MYLQILSMVSMAGRDIRTYSVLIFEEELSSVMIKRITKLRFHILNLL
jgi:hypothetical protein